MLECGDGTTCNGELEGWDCCLSHGKRAKCPINMPIMCEKKDCGGDDHCCEDTPGKCVAKICGKYATTNIKKFKVFYSNIFPS